MFLCAMFFFLLLLLLLLSYELGLFEFSEERFPFEGKKMKIFLPNIYIIYDPILKMQTG